MAKFVQITWDNNLKLSLFGCRLQSYTAATFSLGHLLNSEGTSVHEACVWHLQKSVKCVGSVRWSQCFVFRTGGDSNPSITVRDCWVQWHFICCEGSKVGYCCLWFICCCFSLGSCRGVEEPVLCLNVSSWNRMRLLCPLSYVQYAPMIMMDCPLWVHIYAC